MPDRLPYLPISRDDLLLLLREDKEIRDAIIILVTDEVKKAADRGIRSFPARAIHPH